MKVNKLFLAWLILLFNNSLNAAVISFSELVPIPMYPNAMSGAPTGVGASSTIDADGEKYGAIMTIPRTGNIKAITITNTSITATVTYGVFITNLDSTGLPDPSSFYCASSTASIRIGTSDDGFINRSDDFGSNCSATAGDRVGVYIERLGGSGSWGGAALVDSFFDYNTIVSSVGASGFTKSAGGAGIGFVYSDDTIESLRPNTLGVFGSILVSSSTNPNHAGNKFRIPFEANAVGAWLWADMDGDTSLHISDGSSTYLSTCTFLTAHRQSTSATPQICYFGSDVTISSGTYYFLFGKPTTTTNMTYYDVGVTSEAYKRIITYDVSKSTASNPTSSGSWSVMPERYMSMGILIDRINVPDSGGGGTRGYPFAH